MNWPKALITELASRRCVIFLGSGASASCLSEDGSIRPPKWDQYLEGLITIMNNKSDIVLIRDLIKKEKYLDAAEIIFNSISIANYSTYLRETFQLPRFVPSKIHESVFNIDPKIVITTNYDEIYDNYCKLGNSSNGYNVCKYYDSHLVSDLRSPIRSIIKAHGCISDPQKTILTRSQYFNTKVEYGNFYRVIDSLFITNTILFIGYSISDPDIQLVLENSNIASIGSHPHYLCIGDSIHESIKNAIKKTYNIEFIEFSNGNFDELETGLKELSVEVESQRITNRL